MLRLVSIRPLLLRVGAPLTGVLLALAYPAAGFGPLAFVAFLPLLLSLHAAKSYKDVVVSSLIAGFTFFLLSCYWIAHVSLLGMVAMCAYLALYFVPFGVGVHHCYRGGGTAILWGPFYWVAGEFLRAKVFTGFPWNTLGASQASFLPLVQTASLAGIFSVGFLVMLVNMIAFEGWLAMTRRAPRRWAMLAGIGASVFLCALAYGFSELAKADEPRGTQPEAYRVAAIQPNIPQEKKFDPLYRNEILRRLRQLTLAAAEEGADLIVWPETSVPGEATSEADAKRFVEGLAAEAGVALLVGTQHSQESPQRGKEYFNAAVLVDPERGIARMHRKVHLVPFGEFLPGARWLPFLRWFIPIPEDFSRGEELTIFQRPGATLRWKEADGTLRAEMQMRRFGVAICFEDIFSDLFRRYCLQRPTFMINMTNDAWFKKSAASVQHARLAVFRAVENRIHLLRATNTGFTCLIDPYGRIVRQVKDAGNIFVPGLLVGDIIPLGKRSIFHEMGSFFAHACLILAMVRAFVLIRKRKQSMSS